MNPHQYGHLTRLDVNVSTVQKDMKDFVSNLSKDSFLKDKESAKKGKELYKNFKRILLEVQHYATENRGKRDPQ